MSPEDYVEREADLFCPVPNYNSLLADAEREETSLGDVFNRMAPLHDGYVLHSPSSDFAQMLAYLESVMPCGSLIVDAGCGTGLHLGYLAQKIRSHFIGYDSSENMIRYANERKSRLHLDNVEFHVNAHEDFPNATISEGSADCIYSLYSIPDFQKTVDIFSRLLRRRGKLIIDLYKNDVFEKEKILFDRGFEKIGDRRFPTRPPLAAFEKY